MVTKETAQDIERLWVNVDSRAGNEWKYNMANLLLNPAIFPYSLRENSIFTPTTADFLFEVYRSYVTKDWKPVDMLGGEAGKMSLLALVLRNKNRTENNEEDLGVEFLNSAWHMKDGMPTWRPPYEEINEMLAKRKTNQVAIGIEAGHNRFRGEKKTGWFGKDTTTVFNDQDGIAFIQFKLIPVEEAIWQAESEIASRAQDFADATIPYFEKKRRLTESAVENPTPLFTPSQK